MRQLTCLTALAAIALAVVSVSAKPISSVDEIKSLGAPTHTVNFAELVKRDKAVFGSPELGQPYSKLGLVLPSQIVDATANLAPDQIVGIKSTGVSTIDNSNYQSIAFTTPQKVVAFNVRNAKAKSIIITALDKVGNVVDQTVVDNASETKFVGFMVDAATITVIRVVATHASIADAIDSPTFVSGITFSVSNGSGDTDVAGTAVGDYGLAQAVGVTSGAPNGLAFAGNSAAGFGASGGGGAGNPGFGRNLGNRNPNLPPAIIPEPGTMLGTALLASTYFLRRRRVA